MPLRRHAIAILGPLDQATPACTLPGPHCATHSALPSAFASSQAAVDLPPPVAGSTETHHTLRPAFHLTRTLPLTTTSAPFAYPHAVYCCLKSGVTAKIYAPPEQGAVGAPSPQTGENGASRLTAVTAYTHQPSRPPPSPSVLQQPSPVTQTSPSTVEASPQQTPGPFAAGAEVTGRRPEPSGRMRSSIACARCRRSKTKCENNGTKSICKSCAVAKKECSYDIPTTGANVAGSLRRESTADGEVRGATDSDFFQSTISMSQVQYFHLTISPYHHHFQVQTYSICIRGTSMLDHTMA